MRALCAVALEKNELMSALPIAKVKVAVRKHRPTRTAVLRADVVRGVGAASAATVVVACASCVARFRVAVSMVPPFVNLRCK